MVLEGECNCGAIKVTINDAAENTQPVYCRCLNCRKQSGALGTYVTVISDEDVTVVGSPKDYIDRKTDSGTLLHRWFCGDCGREEMYETPLSDSFADGKVVAEDRPRLLFPFRTVIKMGLFDKILKPVAEVSSSL
ncbi:hypothetical protein CLCR_09145 [Cladophialophora carrionii]|uniref:CENP-V/GFA domain-containing protein n=1 Tax=Cladophialophora carrionii TaxID=86049 RepID=A0A1C1CUV9_9EURO|nr:hypothetical protein CLCR_09145 [Cladophialophora carrionii]